MLEEFIDFVNSVLPSVDPEARDKAKAAIAQFSNDGNQYEFLLSNLLPQLSQGDIISEIPFVYLKDNGEQEIYKAKGMVISTSCHIDQKEILNIVPVLPLDFFDGDRNKKRELMGNKIYDYMYIPENKMKNYFINFSGVNTYSKKLIVNGISSGRLKRECSLSQIGFYLFIIKLTVFFMRSEDEETMSYRES